MGQAPSRQRKELALELSTGSRPRYSNLVYSEGIGRERATSTAGWECKWSGMRVAWQPAVAAPRIHHWRPQISKKVGVVCSSRKRATF